MRKSGGAISTVEVNRILHGVSSTVGIDCVSCGVTPLVLYQPTVVVNYILDRVSSLVGVSCNLANCISPMPTIKDTGEF